MLTQFLPRLFRSRTLYPCLAVLVFLTALAIIPAWSARGKVNERTLLNSVTPAYTANATAPFSPPTISLTTPTNNAGFIAGSTISLSATAMDSDGTVSKVEFYQGAVKLGEDTTDPYTYDWTNVPAGDYVLTAKASDNAGETTTSAAFNISVLAQVKQYVNWSSITNGTDLGNGSVRKTSSGAWDFYSGSLQTLLPGDGYFESTATAYNQSINLSGTDGSGRAIVIGSGGWVGIYENNVLVAATSSDSAVPAISAHVAGDRYRIEITNSVLRYIRYRAGAREVMFTSTAALPAFPISLSLGMSPQNAEWQKTVLAQLTRKVSWSSITNGVNLGNGSVKKTSTGVWDFYAAAVQTLLRGDGYFESTASMYNQSLNLSGSDGAARALVVGTGGWAAIYENGQEVANTSPIGNISGHAAGDRYRLEIADGALRYVRYRSGVRSVMYTSTNPLPAYPLNFGLGASPQNAEWQNTVIAQLSQTVTWSYITNGIDLGNGSVRKTTTGVWDFSAGPKQQLVWGNGFFESTASYYNHSIGTGGSDGAGGALVVGTGGWAAIYENGQEVADTYPIQNLAGHVAGDRYRLEISCGKLRYVRYRAGVRSLMFTSANVVPAYALGYYVGSSFQNSEWQNTIFSDNVPEQNDASFVSQTVATTMVPGQTYNVSVTMRNTGTSTWTPDGDYQLASENLPDNQRWGLNRVNLTTTVLPGSDATFNFTVTAPATGSHSFQWRMVQQGVERFGALTTNVSVQTVNGPPTVNLTSPANNYTCTAGATITLTATTNDSDGTISKLEFFQGSTRLSEIANPSSPYSYDWTNVPAGNYVLTARATDNGGATTTSNAVNITVNPPNVPPTVSITTPANNANFPNDTTITITANAADSDGIVSKVEFFRGGTSLGVDTNGTDGFRYDWSNVQAGSYSLTVKATDNAGAIVTSTPVSITVNLPVVSIVATDADASEPGTNTGVFTVSRTGGTSNPLTVNLALGGTAVAGSDYTSVDTAVTIPSGAASRTIVITPIDDTTVENNETVTVTLSSNAAYTLGSPATATVTIADNDHYLPIVNITSPAVGATFTNSATISITASASEQNGAISKVEFFQGQTNLGEGTNGTNGYTYTWTNVADGSYSLTARATDSYGVAVTSAPVQVNVVNFNLARLDPLNRTGGSGEDPLSRNYNWTMPLVSLPGRAGLDLGLSLSYNSLVWTRSGNYISFNDDRGFPGPGFRLGFPVIQSVYFNTEVGKNAFLLIAPDGSRTELRQVNASSLYEASDSSHLLLDTATSPWILRATDGTQLAYEWKGADYQCTQIKDRNGNYITVNYDASGRLDTVIDTLARSIKFNYNGNDLSSITQTWTVNGAPLTHNWARFTYSDQTIQTNFSGLTVLGPQNNSSLHVLASVKLADEARFDFSYTSWGQVWKISSFALDGHLLNYRSYNLPTVASTAQSDCPRFTERADWAENWNRDVSGNAQAAISRFTEPTGATIPGTSVTGMLAQVTAADDTSQKVSQKIYFGNASSWQKGLPLLTETYDANAVKQRWVATTWTQDDETKSYPLNPRVTETNIYDPSGNHARSRIVYATFNLADGTSPRYPQDTYEYQADAVTVLRTSHVDYQMSSIYTARRILGLPSAQYLCDGSQGESSCNDASGTTLMAKASFVYDAAGSIGGTDAPVQHDNTSYGSGFVVGRGNLSSSKRYDVTNLAQFTTSTVTYNTAGAVVGSQDALSHGVTISYTDSFSDLNNSRNTLAYPTTITDPDGFTSTTRYNFDFGAATRKQTPLPNVTTNQAGPVQTIDYDSIGRLQRVTNSVNNGYTRYEYGPNFAQTYSTVNTVADEAYTLQVFDGAGRVIAKAGNHPGSAGGFSAELIIYDVMGRVSKQSNPTETSLAAVSLTAPLNPYAWVAAGDDAAGWLYTEQTYDWKGRPLVTRNTDGTTKEASYAGCGCAGGEVVTLTDEGTIDAGVAKRRQQKIYSDVLGRQVKTEVLNWQGGSVYATTVNTYNARDQVNMTREFQGSAPGDPNDLSCPTGTCQQTTMTYDGFGRLKTKHVPEQDTNTATTYNYNSDDTPSSVVDARGASQTLTYNNGRHLVTGITYAAPTGIAATPNVSFVYDAAGNRTSMTDGMGTANYSYDQLSRMTDETRMFTALAGTSSNGNYHLGYEYNVSGKLSSITDPSGGRITYARDLSGRISNINGSTFAGVDEYAHDIAYRAWGKLKHFSFGRITETSSLNTVAFTYGARLQTSGYNITTTKVGTVQNGASYQYFDDGRLKYSIELTNGYQDHAYRYDQAARITQALTGAEARGESNPNSGAVPFSQNYAYNVWNNLTQRSGKVWENNIPTFSANYGNGRNAAWTYDASGNVTHDDARQYTYDAAGQVVTTTEPPPRPNRPALTVTQEYDGSGQRLKLTDNGTVTFEVRSSVLDGQLIADVTAQGQETTGYVYADGNLIAKQTHGTNPSVTWTLAAPDGSGKWEVSDGYVPLRTLEIDPMGDEVPVDPSSSGGDDLGNYPAYGDAANFSGSGCALDGNPINCEVIGRIVSRNQFAVLYNIINKRVGAHSRVERATSANSGRSTASNAYGTFDYQSNAWSAGMTITAEADYFDVSTVGYNMSWVDMLPTIHPIAIVPQKTQILTIDPTGIRNALERMLRSGDCGRFVQELINQIAAGTGKPFVSDYVLDLFDMVERQGGFVRGGEADKYRVSATVSGHINSKGTGDAAIHINSHFNGPVPASIVNFLDAFNVLHELVHHARPNRYYDDRQAAVALFKMTGTPGLPVRADYKSDSEFIGANSTYFSNVLSSKCPVLSR